MDYLIGDPTTGHRPDPIWVQALEEILGGRVALRQHEFDPDLREIVMRGESMPLDKYKRELIVGRPGQCWFNASCAFLDGLANYIVLGYAKVPRGYGGLPSDSDWWALQTYGIRFVGGRPPTIIEAIHAVICEDYYGLILTGEESKRFADYTMAYFKKYEYRPFQWTAEAMAAGAIPVCGPRFTGALRR